MLNSQNYAQNKGVSGLGYTIYDTHIFGIFSESAPISIVREQSDGLGCHAYIKIIQFILDHFVNIFFKQISFQKIILF
jgi:hypothetical protein